MRKSFVLVSLIFSLFFFSFVDNYDAKTLECTYKIPLSGSSNHNSNPIIKLKFDNSNGPLEISMNGSELQLFSVNDSFLVSKNNKADDFYIMLGQILDMGNIYLNDYDMDNNPDGELVVCPDLVYTLDEDKVSNIHKFGDEKKGYRVNVIKLYSVNGGFQFGATQKLILTDNSGENLGGDKYNKDKKTTCPPIEIPASKVLNDNKLTNIFDIEVSTYEDGRVFVSVDGNGEYISSVPDDNGIVWKKYSTESGSYTFIIRESEVNEIKNAFPYGGSCNTSLRITPVEIKGTVLTSTYYAISVNPISDGKNDGVTLDPSYDVNKDPDFNFSFNIDDNSSDFSSLCTDYLGHASEEDTIANLLDRLYTLIKLGSIILVIVLGLIDFSSVITSSKDELSNVVKKTAKRLVILVIILLLPFLIDLVCGLFGYPDILCGIK